MCAALGPRRDVRIIECGVRLKRLNRPEFDGPVITCGLAGGLTPELSTGSVVIAQRVMASDGRVVECDEQLFAQLMRAARDEGHEPHAGMLLTSEALVNGASRAAWLQRGCIAVDMETGLVRAPRIACVRAVLDTPARELSDAWLAPWTIAWRPDAWPQIGWIAREGPRCARVAARVLAKALLDRD
ncbi:MAG: hypothetical protein JO194_11030 [Candidatus Eremiobacteraeota bacterium]|nr:hypothetical protein [Candidatus Eremiobacteraeota bacterium]